MSPRIARALKKAEQLAKQGEFSAARGEYHRILTQFPGNKNAASGLRRLQNADTGVPSVAELEDLTDLSSKGLHFEVVEKAKALRQKYPQHKNVLGLQGIAFMHLNRTDEAIETFTLLTDVTPNSPAAFYNYGAALKMAQRLEEALSAFVRSDELRPNHLKTQLELADIHFKLGNFEDARQRYETAIQINPSEPGYHFNLGNTLSRLGESHRACLAFQEAIRLDPRNRDFQYNIASEFKKLERYEDAAKALRNVIKLDPQFLSAHASLGEVYSDLSDSAAAEACFTEAIRLAPTEAGFRFKLCELLDRTGQVKALKEALEDTARILGNDREVTKLAQTFLAHREDRYADALVLLEGAKGAISAGFAKKHAELLGKTHDRLGNYPAAFKEYSRHNQMVQDELSLAGTNTAEYVNQLKEVHKTWKGDFLADWRSNQTAFQENQLVFMVGFPRSGTTLLDTILRGHPEIEVLEEKKMVFEVLERFGGKPGFEDLDQLNDQQLDSLRRTYLETLKTERSGIGTPRIIIDKLPLNLASAGLLHRLFPRSKFILALRHPCDCVLSCYMQMFKPNQAMNSFLKLESSAELYDVAMSLWHEYVQKLDIPFYQIRYEDVVEDLRGTVEPLVNYLGLEWHDEQADYQKTALRRDRINTPSYNQVTKPLYKQAKGRWENYREQMEPVLPLLLPWAQRFGYSG